MVVTWIDIGKTKTIRKFAEDGDFSSEIGELLIPPRKWKGMTQDDIKYLHTIFDPKDSGTGRAPAEDWSMCPICLGYTGRQDGCKYMKHDYRIQQSYDKKLYDRYKDPIYGTISWCTVQ